jgi:hypothetical protein
MRIYKCPFGFTAETVAVDLLELTPADDKGLLILRLHLGQTTEVGDAQEEFISTAIVRGNTTSGSGGVAAANANPVGPSDATSGFTFESLNTTQASAGTAKTLAQPTWAVRGGLDHVYLPEERDEVTQGQTLLCWRLGAAPVDSITMGGYATVAEAG